MPPPPPPQREDSVPCVPQKVPIPSSQPITYPPVPVSCSVSEANANRQSDHTGATNSDSDPNAIVNTTAPQSNPDGEGGGDGDDGFTLIDRMDEPRQDQSDRRSVSPDLDEAALFRVEASDNHDQYELEKLRRQVKSLTARAEIAEDKMERAEESLNELQSSLAADQNQTEEGKAKDHTELLAAAEKLKKENHTLREQLRDAQSHIFSLQPYRKEMTPEEVGREYDDLIESVSDWVQKFMTRWLDNQEASVEHINNLARKRPNDLARFKRTLQRYPDLVNASMYPETDEDVIISMILRYLHDNIFQKILYGSIQDYVAHLTFVETAMQSHVDPKRDLFAIRTWVAEAYNALISAPQFKMVKDKRLRSMSKDLTELFEVFCAKGELDAFYSGFAKACVQPAMTLYEKLQVSTHHFYLDLSPFIFWGRTGDMETSTEFLDRLGDLGCKNILQNRKTFNPEKLEPRPTKKELYHLLANVCTISPALYMRQIGQKDAIKLPQLVRRQQMLVSWGPSEKREKFMTGDRTLVSHIYESKTEGWSFRWPQ